MRHELELPAAGDDGEIMVSAGEVAGQGGGGGTRGEEMHQEAAGGLQGGERLRRPLDVERDDGFGAQRDGVEGRDGHAAEGVGVVRLRVVRVGRRDDGHRVRYAAHQQAHLIGEGLRGRVGWGCRWWCCGRGAGGFRQGPAGGPLEALQGGEDGAGVSAWGRRLAGA